jgi:hypothetical protein
MHEAELKTQPVFKISDNGMHYTVVYSISSVFEPIKIITMLGTVGAQTLTP